MNLSGEKFQGEAYGTSNTRLGMTARSASEPEVSLSKWAYGRQNSKMAPRSLTPGVHVIYNPFLLRVGGTWEYKRISFS